jgi:tetratricopeptide (TPR) repeat protein
MTEAHAVASAEELTMTAKLLLRRGIVNCSLGYFDAAKDDYEELRRRLGGGVQLMEVSASDVADDLSKINIMVEVDALKRKADGMLSQGVAEDAITLYSQALSLFPLHAGCVANRATSYLALGNLDRCIDDTTTALSILEESDKAHVSHARQKGVNVLASILPATGSAKWKAWKMKVLAKRGAAFAQLGQLDAAIRDFAEMCALDPKDAAVKSDLNKLQTLRMQSTSVTSAQSQVQACQ